MNTNFVPEIVAKQSNALPLSFYAYIQSAYWRIRYTIREQGFAAAAFMLAEFERVHRDDHLYWTHRRQLDSYISEAQAPVAMAKAA